VGHAWGKDDVGVGLAEDAVVSFAETTTVYSTLSGALGIIVLGAFFLCE
jgi:hypothetical protein